MGTNIYLKKKLTTEDKKKVLDKMLKELRSYSINTFEKMHNMLYELADNIKSGEDTIHICKRSAGWQLLFREHKDLYDSNWNALEHFIRKQLDENNYIMVDEYDRHYTLEDLENDLIGHKDGYTLDSYIDNEIKEGHHVYVPLDSREYISDNMRWCTVDFS